MVYTIAELQRIITPIAQKYRLRAVYLFGSYARGTATENSDVDLLIDTDSLKQRAQMPSESDFRLAVAAERKTLYAVA